MDGILLLKILLGLGLTTSGILRLTYPDIGESERKSLNITDPTTGAIIALFELVGFPVLFCGSKLLEKVYLILFCTVVIIISIIYLQTRSFSEIRSLIAFTNDSKTIYYHLIIVTIMIAIMMR